MQLPSQCPKEAALGDRAPRMLLIGLLFEHSISL